MALISTKRKAIKKMCKWQDEKARHCDLLDYSLITQLLPSNYTENVRAAQNHISPLIWLWGSLQKRKTPVSFPLCEVTFDTVPC